MKTSKPPVSPLRRLPFRRLLFLVALAAFAAGHAITPALRAQDIPSSLMKLPDLRPAKKPVSDKWTFSFLPVGLQRNPQVDYAIVTEMTDDGRKLPDPSFEHPVYYISHSVGQHDVGDAYGGTKPIEYANLKNQLDSSLAANGYRSSDETHPPTQVLFITWGMFNRGYNEENGLRGDLLARAKLIGGQKFADEYAQARMEGRMAMREFSQRDDLTETLVYAVSEECYYLLVTALDLEALQRNERKILWTTKISTVARGVSFQSTLPIMINNASYYFGRETNGAEILRKRAYKRADVTIGEASVVEYMSGTTASSGTSAANPPPAENPKSQNPKSQINPK